MTYIGWKDGILGDENLFCLYLLLIPLIISHSDMTFDEVNETNDKCR